MAEGEVAVDHVVEEISSSTKGKVIQLMMFSLTIL